MKIRLFRSGIFDALLIAVLLMLMYAFIRQHNKFSAQSSTPPPQSLNLDLVDKSGHKRVYASDTSVLIDNRIKQIGESRPRLCQRIVYNLKEKATLVIDFNDYQFYDLKNTIQSVLNQNYDEILEEIIVVDDGSTLEYIRQDVEKYLKTVPKSRLISFATQQGTLKARMAAMAVVKTDIVVFLDANVICSRGWLEPLIDLLIKDKNVIALPHYDRIRSPVTLEYERTANGLVATPTWNFAIKMRLLPEPPNEGSSKLKKYYYNSPALRGNAFALRKTFLDSIGSFDAQFEEGSGDILELSLRTWMCGGMIETVTCSRVGVLNFEDQVRPYSQKNCQRIAGLWYGEMKEVALRLSGMSAAISETDEAQIAARKKYITSLRECKDIYWYMQDVAKELVFPSRHAVKLGILTIMTGRCALLAEDSKIDLIDCKEVENGTANAVFELTTTGHLMLKGKCVTTENTAYIRLHDCRGDDKQQLWSYKGMQLRNVWSNFCATHVTDPDRNIHNRQIMMAQQCEVPTEHKPFNQWQFLSK